MNLDLNGSNGSVCLDTVEEEALVITIAGVKYPFPRAFNQERKRYADDELEVFRKIILDKRDKAWFDYRHYAPNEGNGTDGTSPTYKGVTEEGAPSLSVEESNKLAQRQLKFIGELNSGLVRIENKTFGICTETGKLIHPRRMAAVPHCTLSFEAKN
jgi:RNA polymerase-binding transcription factor DksA